jgi:hypothetical protein
MAQASPSFSSHQEQARIVRISGRGKGQDRLPPPDTRRWVMRRKAQVVAAVRGGDLTLDQACERYSLSKEEFESWIDLVDHHGVRGLRATRMQEYRPVDERLHHASAE